MLQAGGYYTGFVGKWHVASVPTEIKHYQQGKEGKITSDSSPNHKQRAVRAGYAEARAQFEPDIQVRSRDACLPACLHACRSRELTH